MPVIEWLLTLLLILYGAERTSLKAETKVLIAWIVFVLAVLLFLVKLGAAIMGLLPR